MNREIKFRCYVHAFKEMYWFDIMNGNRHGTGSGYISMTPVGEPITKGLHKDNIIPIDPTENPIMQYTGLHDKNGVEIYEGDVVKLVEYKRQYEVVFKDTAFKLIHCQNDGLKGVEWGNISRIFEIPEQPTIEVIGNIYNPELIKYT